MHLLPRSRMVAFRTPGNATPRTATGSMDLATSVPAARSICVLGAGNCADVDLTRLALAFEQIDLVDLDVEALQRSHERAPAEAREKLTLHGDVDLSGVIEHLDPWGDEFPEAPDLAKQALLAARSIVQRVGRPFDVVLSTCVLSQLPIPFQRAWIMRESSWANLIGAIRAVHLATLAGLTRPGGTGVIAFDVLSSGEVPALGDFENVRFRCARSEGRGRGSAWCVVPASQNPTSSRESSRRPAYRLSFAHRGSRHRGSGTSETLRSSSTPSSSIDRREPVPRLPSTSRAGPRVQVGDVARSSSRALRPGGPAECARKASRLPS